MPNFEYTARDMRGNELTGTLPADGESQLRKALRLDGLFVTHAVRAENQEANSASLLFIGKRVRLGDMVIFSRQLATMVRAGLTILDALDAVESQTENQVLGNIVRDVRKSVMQGKSLADSMKKHPKVFSKLYLALVQAGEVSGSLDQTLEIAGEQIEKESQIQEQIRAALTYPKLVVVASFGMVVFMLMTIVPTFSKVYAQMSAKLPASTMMLISVSKAGRTYWYVFAIAAGSAFFGFQKFKESEKGRAFLDRISLRIPFIGQVVRKIAIGRFAQTFAGAVRGGIPILQALEVSGNTAGNTTIQTAIEAAANRVQGGQGLATSLENSGQFPSMVVRMVAAGERSGELDEMLEHIAKFYQRDADHAIGKLTKLLEPIMTVLVGFIVLFILSALYMPVFSIGKIMKR